MGKLNFCVFCGYKLDHSEKFCPSCGSNLKEIMDSEDDLPREGLNGYESRINKLKDSYDEKEKKALDLVKKSFTPDEITYSRFVEQLNRNHEIFYKKVELALELNDLLDDSSLQIDDKIEKTIKLMEDMLEQLKSLIVEFIIHPIYDKKSDEDISALREEMDNLIHSIKNYQ